MKRYTIYTYQPEGFSHGWKDEQSDTIPEGAVSVSVWDRTHADMKTVYYVDSQAPVQEDQP